MKAKIGFGLVAILVLFLGYVSTRESHFHYEKSGLIQATPEKIFPYLSNFHLGSQWNPYAKKDPNMKTVFKGPESGVSSVMEFDGNSEAGTGSLEILGLVPNQRVEIRLLMTKPMHADNRIVYSLTPEGTATRFTWSMEGDGGFVGKLMTLLIDCEKMVTKDFEQGIKNLKATVET